MPSQRKQRHQSPNRAVDVPTGPDSKIWDVIDAVPCDRHETHRRIGRPCHVVGGLTGLAILGICNDRAVKAGFNHPISPEAMRGRVQPKY